MRRTWFTSGDWNFICDVCGFKRKASEGLERWDGLMVCAPSVKAGCWEVRHPQELIRPIPDQQNLPWTRPESTDIYLPDHSILARCTIEGQLCQADYATADCAIVGNITH